MPVDRLTGVAGVSAGDFYTVAVRTNGRAFAWGSSRFGQIGHGMDLTYTSPVRMQHTD